MENRRKQAACILKAISERPEYHHTIGRSSAMKRIRSFLAVTALAVAFATAFPVSDDNADPMLLPY